MRTLWNIWYPWCGSQNTGEDSEWIAEEYNRFLLALQALQRETKSGLKLAVIFCATDLTHEWFWNIEEQFDLTGLKRNNRNVSAEICSTRKKETEMNGNLNSVRKGDVWIEEERRLQV